MKWDSKLFQKKNEMGFKTFPFKFHKERKEKKWSLVKTFANYRPI
jgi:hypothetical protein